MSLKFFLTFPLVEGVKETGNTSQGPEGSGLDTDGDYILRRTT